MNTKAHGEHELNRYNYIKDSLSRYKEESGDRVQESKNLINEDLWLIDPHTHSDFSDGRGTVTENYDVAMACGLDYVYITDHHTVEQKKYSKMIEGISWGQEPIAGREHIVLLNGKEAFVPDTDNLAELYKKACEIGSFVFLPHQGGQGIPISDVDGRLEILKSIGPKFSMEVMNGLFHMFKSWDKCDKVSVSLWDRLLQDGYQVTPIGSSDAHEPFSIGTAFTGVFCQELRQSKLAEALRAGNCFASEAPLLQLTCNDASMGETISSFAGNKLRFNIKAADVYGLKTVRIVSEGYVIKRYDIDNKSFMEESYTYFSGKKSTYYRLEVISKDDRRAFSAPVYVTI